MLERSKIAFGSRHPGNLGFIQTGERTVLSYLTKSLRDQVARTFRDG